MRFLGLDISRAGKENRRMGEKDRLEKRLSEKYHIKRKGLWERIGSVIGNRLSVIGDRSIDGVKQEQAARSQTREYWDSPFACTFSTYQPFKFNLDLYDMIRESIPICDVAIIKLGRLIGDFELTAENDRDLEFLNDFKKNVRVNHFEKGFNALRGQVTDSAMAKGMGFYEVIPTRSMTDIYRLKVARANDFRFIRQDDKLVLGQVTAYNDFTPVPFENQDYVYYLAFDRRDGHPQGYSLFYSLPFVSQIEVRILKSLENQLWRMGDPSFIFMVEKGGESAVYSNASKAISMIQDQVESVMQDRKQGKIRDIYAALPGDSALMVQAIGNEKDLMKIEVPMRTVLEQIVAKTNLPPWMLGLSWSTTERLSTHQNDMIVSMVETFRDDWNPLIEKVFDTYIALHGRAGMKWGFEWNAVNLMDEVEIAKARHLNASSAEKEIANMTTLVSYGWVEADEAIDALIENGVISNKIVARLGKIEMLKRLQRITMEKRAGEILSRVLIANRSNGNGYHEVERYQEALVDK